MDCLSSSDAPARHKSAQSTGQVCRAGISPHCSHTAALLQHSRNKVGMLQEGMERRLKEYIGISWNIDEYSIEGLMFVAVAAVLGFIMFLIFKN